MSKGAIASITDKLFYTIFGDCNDIFHSPKPNKYALRKCVESGKKPIINCDSVLTFGNTTNGSIFTKCMQERGLTLYKFVNDSNIHGQFKYKDGTNKDTNKFNPSGSCAGGGLYYADSEHILSYSNFGQKICKVTIQPHASVYVDTEKYKADEIDVDLKNAMTIEEYVKKMTKNELLLNISSNSKIILIIDFINLDLMDDEICEKLILSYANVTNRDMIQKIKEYVKKKSMSEDQIIEFAKKNPKILYYLDDDVINENLCMRLLSENVHAHYINIFAKSKYNDFTRNYFEVSITKFPFSDNIYDVPDKYIDEEMCIFIEKHYARHLLLDNRFKKYLTYAQCKSAIEDYGSFDSLPENFKTNELQIRYNYLQSLINDIAASY